MWLRNAYIGDIVWPVPLSLTETRPSGKQNTGRSGAFAGPLAAAGASVFIGAKRLTVTVGCYIRLEISHGCFHLVGDACVFL